MSAQDHGAGKGTGYGAGHGHGEHHHVELSFAQRWLFSTNHKDIGTLYIIFGLVGGIAGLIVSILMRMELQSPGMQIFASGQSWNAAITSHGLLMIFFSVMPVLIGGFGNWFIPQTAEVMHGNVVIQMRVLRNGTLANIQLVRPSGIDAFDRAAMTALRLSTPTLPLPDNYPVDAIDPFTVIFYYNEPIR